jgi:hypothetical protein
MASISRRTSRGGGLGLLGQLADLVGHHGEAASGLSGPGRLDGRVQRQKVGLVRDVADHAHDPADGLGLAAEHDNGLAQFGGLGRHGLDGTHGAHHGLRARPGPLHGGGRLAGRCFGTRGRLGDGGGHFLHGRGRPGHEFLLLARALARSGRGLFQIAGGPLDAADGLLQCLGRRVQGLETGIFGLFLGQLGLLKADGEVAVVLRQFGTRRGQGRFQSRGAFVSFFDQ